MVGSGWVSKDHEGKRQDETKGDDEIDSIIVGGYCKEYLNETSMI